jgi:hypothetical protein
MAICRCHTSQTLGGEDMQSIQPLLNLWRKWFNRNKLFKADEMNELESHLLDEIDYIKEHDKLSEEQAFQKAVQHIGQMESLDKEYDKNHGFTYPKFVFWFRNHTLQLFIASLLVIVFLIGDFQFSQSHTMNIKLNEEYLDKTLHPIFTINPDNSFKINYTSLSGTKNETIQWKVNQGNQSGIRESSPLYLAPISIFEKDYLIVLDDQKQLWMEESEIFTSDSHRFILETNTDWMNWKSIYRGEIKKRRIPLSTINLFPNNSILSDQTSTLISSEAIFPNPLDLDIFLSGDNNTVLNRFTFLPSDQSKVNCSEILFYEAKEQYPFFISYYRVASDIDITTPNLFIRSYQLERRALHILPYLYQQISSRLFRREAPQEQKQVTPE